MANPLIFAEIAERILGVIEKFLDPKQYDIVRMKRQQKAIDWAEQEFNLMEEMLNRVPDEKTKKLHDRNYKYFQKFN